ncbi:MAG: hypothetical protein ACR2GY_13705 [Phycisphaerales bacterium]
MPERKKTDTPAQQRDDQKKAGDAGRGQKKTDSKKTAENQKKPTR